jgi:sec-independent protein translocase protein TatC
MQPKKSFLEHLEELRLRIIKSFIFLIITSFITYFLLPYIFPFLTRPVGKLIFISPYEALSANIYVSIFGGFFLSSPFIFYQFWKFISSGLRKKEKRYLLYFGLFSFLLFIFGAVFGYMVILPLGVKFLLKFSNDYLQPMITASNYLGFVFVVTLIFGVVFQIPLIILFLTKLGIIDYKVLIQRRKEIIVFIFIISAFITPPDVVTQLFMAIPLLILYELSIFLSKINKTS